MSGILNQSQNFMCALEWNTLKCSNAQSQVNRLCIASVGADATAVSPLHKRDAAVMSAPTEVLWKSVYRQSLYVLTTIINIDGRVAKY